MVINISEEHVVTFFISPLKVAAVDFFITLITTYKIA
jgi:hypothetical protein